MRINVTQAHIDRARNLVDGDATDPCFTCPVALAMIDAGFENVEVMGDGSIDGKRMAVSVQKFINDFDARLKVEPFAFNFTSMPAVARQLS